MITERNQKNLLSLATSFIFLTILIIFPDFVFLVKNKNISYLLAAFLIVPVLLCIPVFLFFRNLKIYYYFLAFISCLAPLSVLPVILVNSQMNFEMLSLAMDSNIQEVVELVGWRIFPLILAMISFFLIFIRISKKLPKKISFYAGIKISLIASAIFLITPFIRKMSFDYNLMVLKNIYRLYYPFRISNALPYIKSELNKKETYRKSVMNFSFNAKRKLIFPNRNIHVLIVGETARYDRWTFNGYHRNTSPNLENLKNFISFSNVSTGGTITNISIPLIITSAEADYFDKHTKEKSILTAFKEVGYRSYWISNQSKYGFSGSIGMHYFDGDSTLFTGWGANESHFKGNTDSSLLPLIENVLNNEKNQDLFLVVHMIGSHWKYNMRYPNSFTKFVPVSKRNTIEFGFPSKELLWNEYDNSIYFTDYILHEIISKIKNQNCLSTVTYVSDHGENLGDDINNPKYIHSFLPNKVTAHIPFFIWASDQYISHNRLKYELLLKNSGRPISSASNTFHTILDLAGISVSAWDSTKSVSSSYFTNSDQKILGEGEKIYYFPELK